MDPVEIQGAGVRVFRIPTESPESDGTLEWDRTTLVLVTVQAGGKSGLGYTYADGSAATLVSGKLAGVIAGMDAMSPPAASLAMVREVRNLGRPGIASMAISAVDAALWDLKARLLGLPLVTLLGAVRRSIMVYGSGGFTSETVRELQRQLGGWVEEGIRAVKMKVGRRPDEDPGRVAAARAAIGPDAALFVDANGAYSRKQALRLAEAFAAQDVRWLEEPVSSDDLQGLRRIRDRAPAGMDVAAGEYGWGLPYFERMAPCVDVLQVDVTRAGGITGTLETAALANARGLPLSIHCAPAISAAVACAAPAFVHLEWFFDHVRIERMVFEGAGAPADGRLEPDRGRPGNGLALKEADAKRWEV